MKSPLSGEVVEVNPLLAERPETVHADPYGAGWLVRLRPTRLDAERAALLQGDAALPAMAAHARLFQVE